MNFLLSSNVSPLTNASSLLCSSLCTICCVRTANRRDEVIESCKRNLRHSEMSDSTSATDTAVQVIGFDVEGRGNVTSGAIQEKRNLAENQPFPTGSPLPISIPPIFNPTNTDSTSDNPTVSDLTKQLTPRVKPPVNAAPRQSKSSSGGTGKKKAKPEKPPVQVPVSTPCLSLFDHLDQFKPFSKKDVLRQEIVKELDPGFVEFCISYGEGHVHESIACRNLVNAFCQSVELFKSEESLFYTREYLTYFNHQIGFLVSCRALNISMRNSIRSLKVEVSRLKSGIPLEEGKASVKRLMQSFLEERVDVNEIIAKEANDLIKDEDIILTFCSSETVFSVLSYAWKEHSKKFRVMVVDSRPSLSGRGFLRRLAEVGIPCSYLMINAVGVVLKEVSKVILGASAILSNGTVVGTIGSASISALARERQIPTIFCCQTLKFHDGVQLDAFTQNELGDPELLKCRSREDSDSAKQYLSLLNLKYDLTPSSFVSVIITELGFVPASSVPVILREQATERETSEFN